MNRHISEAAAHKIFADTWGQYTALLEADPGDNAVGQDFIIDIQYQLRLLFPINGSFVQVHQRLLKDPKCRKLSTTRACLGIAFLDNALWPCKNYFSNGK